MSELDDIFVKYPNLRICPKCRVGNLVATGNVYYSFPLQYLVACGSCGFTTSISSARGVEEISEEEFKRCRGWIEKNSRPNPK